MRHGRERGWFVFSQLSLVLHSNSSHNHFFLCMKIKSTHNKVPSTHGERPLKTWCLDSAEPGAVYPLRLQVTW